MPKHVVAITNTNSVQQVLYTHPVNLHPAGYATLF